MQSGEFQIYIQHLKSLEVIPQILTTREDKTDPTEKLMHSLRSITELRSEGKKPPWVCAMIILPQWETANVVNR